MSYPCEDERRGEKEQSHKRYVPQCGLRYLMPLSNCIMFDVDGAAVFFKLQGVIFKKFLALSGSRDMPFLVGFWREL